MGQYIDNISQINPNQHDILKKGMVNKSGKTTLSYQKDSSMMKYCKRVKKMKSQIDDRSFLLLPKIIQTNQEQFCSIKESISLLYDSFEFTLFMEIKRRQKNKKYFTQPQLWFLLYACTKGCMSYQKKNQKSGDIRPKNILLNNKGFINIINNLSFPNEQNNYYKSLLNKQVTYLAPQQLAELQNNNEYCQCNPFIAESFSIGLTILDAALLTNCQVLYNLDKIDFDRDLFQDKIIAFKNMKYSMFFTKTIFNLLQYQVINRPTPGQTHAILQPYQNQIMQLMPFVPNKQKSAQSLTLYQRN